MIKTLNLLFNKNYHYTDKMEKVEEEEIFDNSLQKAYYDRYNLQVGDSEFDRNFHLGKGGHGYVYKGKIGFV